MRQKVEAKHYKTKKSSARCLIAELVHAKEFCFTICHVKGEMRNGIFKYNEERQGSYSLSILSIQVGIKPNVRVRLSTPVASQSIWFF